MPPPALVPVRSPADRRRGHAARWQTPPTPISEPTDLAADRATALALTPVSRETEGRLDRFVALLRQWQQRVNLIAPSTEPIIWTRHIADSLQLLALAPKAKIWVDLGSGGGFPGLVLLAERPNAPALLFEKVD